MAFPRRRPNFIPAEVRSNPDILGGEPCVSGTRVPAMTIVAELRAGATRGEIFENYPSLPFDGIEAVTEWAEANGIPIQSPVA
jgi:uncharacterized protein (DUF433 family)